MKTIQRMFELNLTPKEVVWGKRILAVVILPVLVFYTTSMNFIFLGMMQAQAAGNGSIRLTSDDTVEADSTQTHTLIYTADDTMTGGSLKVHLPSNWQTTPKCEDPKNVDISDKSSGVVIGSLSCGSDYLEIPITTMVFDQRFKITFSDFKVAKIAGSNYKFETESKLSGGSYHSISSPDITVTPGTVASYTVSTPSGVKVGNNFDVTVTAKDALGNTTTGETVAITATGGTTGVLSGDTSKAIGSSATTATLKYTKAETITIHATDGSKIGDSNSFTVAGLTAPTFSSPASSTNDSTPLINWGDVVGTGVEYTLKMVKLSGSGDVCDSSTVFTSPLLSKSDGEIDHANTKYQLASAEALIDESYYCIKINTIDDYLNSIDGYKRFSLLTAPIAAPSDEIIPLVGDAASFGHPADKINIYNVDSVSVAVTHQANLAGGKVFVEIKDGLGEIATGNASISGSATTETIVSGINTSSLQQGSLTIKSRVEDATTNIEGDDANSSLWSTGSTVTKDTSSPAKPSDVSFADNPVNVSNQGTVDFNVTGESGTNAYYTISSSGGGSATDASGNFNMTAGTTNSGNKSLSGLNDGTLTASVYLVDSAWNHSSAKTGTVTKDAAAPTVVLSTVSPEPTKDSPIHVTAIFSESVTGFEIGDVVVGNGAKNNFAGSGATYTFDVTPAGQGAVTVDVAGGVAQDAATNPNIVATQLSRTYDSIVPTVSFAENVEAGPVTSDTITGDWGDATIKKWKYNDNATCSAVAGDYDKIHTDSINQATQTNNGKWICLYGEDAAGNKSTSVSANDINIDITGPALTFTNNVEAGPVASDTIAATWGDAIVLKWDYDTDGACSNDPVAYTKTNSDLMNQTTETNNGKWICVYGADALGNKSTLASANDINIDSSAPAVTAIATDPNSESNGQTFNIVYTANDGTGVGGIYGRIFYKLNGEVVWHQYDYPGVADDYVAYTGGNSTISFTAPQAGSYEFYVQVKDSLNNASSAETPTDTITVIPNEVWVCPVANGSCGVGHTANWNAFNTIQAGIDAIKEGSSNTVHVAEGTYTENVNVNKSITLTGVGSSSVTVSAASASAHVFNVTASNVTISGFRATGATGSGSQAYAGINLQSSNRSCNIHDNILTGDEYGILLIEPENTIVAGNNTFTNNAASNNSTSGIEMQHSYGNTFTGNTANSNGSSGFKLDSARNNTFTSNTANLNQRGFYLTTGAGIGSNSNTFTSNTANSNTRHGIHLIGVSNSNTLTSNTFSGNTTTGIKLQNEVSNLTVNSNTVTNNGTGINISNENNPNIPNVTTWTVSDRNNISGNTTYNISNAGKGTLNAVQNWWGSADDAVVASKISGSVDFLPFCGEETCNAANLTTGIAPTITNVSSDKANGNYKVGEVIDVDVTFSESVTSTGDVTVTLETGATDRNCTFTVAGASTGTCNYTVQTGDTSADLAAASISGTITDAAGNAMTNFAPAANFATKDIVIDTTAPTMESITPTDGAYVKGSQDFVFDFADANNLSYLELDIYRPGDTQSTKLQLTLPADNAQIQTALPSVSAIGVTSASYDPATKKWTATVDTTKAAWRDGDTKFYMEVGDAAGNQWGDMDDNPAWGGLKFNTYKFDNTAPTIDNVDNIVVQATSADGASVTIAAPMSHDTVDGDIVSSCDYATGTFPIGVITVTCSKTDTAGNVAIPETFTVTVQDTTAPTMESITPTDGAYVKGSQDFVFDFADANNLSYLELDIYRPGDTQSTKLQLTLPADNAQIQTALPSVSAIGVTSASYDPATKKWTATVDTTKAAWRDGDTKFYMEVGDAAGNQWGDMDDNPAWGGLKFNTYKFDNTAPTAAITYSSGTVKQGDALTIMASFSENMADALVPKITISGANTLSATAMTKTDATHYTYEHTVGAGNGDATVALSIGTDLAGNVITSTPTSGATFAIDNIAPVAGTVNIPAGTYNSAQSVTITTASDAVSTYYTIDGTEPSNSHGASGVGPIAIDAADGVTITLKYISYDAVGNPSSVTSAAYLFDKVGPTIVITRTPDRNFFNNDYSFTVNYGDSVPATMQYRVDGGTWTLYNTPPIVVSSLGLHTFDAKSSDAAGNLGTADQVVFTIDKTPPTAAITYSDSDGKVKAGDLLTITATFSEPMLDAPIPQITIAGENTVAQTNMTKVDDTHYTYVHTVGAGNGTANVTLQAGTDRADNVITATPTSGGSFTVDNTAPAAPASIGATPASWSTTNSFAVNWTNPVDATGIIGAHYRIDGGTENYVAGAGISSLSGLSVSGEGTHIVKVWLEDLVGNKDETNNSSTANLYFDATVSSAPTVTSSTHSVEANWYNNNDPALDWAGLTDTSRITGYSYILDQAVGTEPDNTSEGAGTSTNYTDKADGIWYFHVKAQNGSGLWSATTHRTVKIDTSVPASSVTSLNYDRSGTITVTISNVTASPSGVQDVDLYARYDSNNDGDYVDANEFDWTNQNLAATPNAVNGTFSFNPQNRDGWYQFYSRAENNAGIWEVAPVGDVADDSSIFDNTDPSSVSVSALPDHIVNGWSKDTTIDYSWVAATDATSGIAGYSYVLDNNTGTDPGNTVDTTGTTYSPTVSVDGDYYLHIAGVDNAGNADNINHYGPIRIDTTKPSVTHTAVTQADAGADINIDATITDTAGSGLSGGLASLKVYYKRHSDSGYTSLDMSSTGGDGYRATIPDEENSDYNVHYYIEVKDNAGNTTREPTSDDYTIDIIPAALDHFTFIYPTSGTRYAGTWFTTVVEARDQFNNVATQYDTGDTVDFTTDEPGVSAFVQDTSTNTSTNFDQGIWAGKVQFGRNTTGGITPSGNNIQLIATGSGKTGSVSMNTSGADFGSTIVPGTVEGAQNNGGASPEGVAPEGAPQVLGEESPTGGEQGTPASEGTGNPWKQAAPYAAAGAILLTGIWLWLKKRGGGSSSGENSGSPTGLLLATLKTAASKIRMFLW